MPENEEKTVETSPFDDAVKFVLEGEHEEKTPETKQEPVVESKVELSKKATEINSQFAALRRQKDTLQRSEAKLIEERKRLDEERAEWSQPKTVVDMVAASARARGVPIKTVWDEVIDEIKNEGKPSEAVKTQRELEAIKRKLEAEDNEKKQQASEREKNSERQDWGNKIDSIIQSPKAKTLWPKLSAIPFEKACELIAGNAMHNERESGKLPDRYELLDALEEALPEPAKPPAEEQKKAVKVKVPTSEAQNETFDVRDDMSESEREEIAARWLKSQGF